MKTKKCVRKYFCATQQIRIYGTKGIKATKKKGKGKEGKRKKGGKYNP